MEQLTEREKAAFLLGVCSGVKILNPPNLEKLLELMNTIGDYIEVSDTAAAMEPELTDLVHYISKLGINVLRRETPQ